MSSRKGKFGKFGPQKKGRNMDKIQCYGCNELGHYRKDCPKSNKDKRKKEKAHIVKEREEPDERRSERSLL